jgi:hypothetical protein
LGVERKFCVHGTYSILVEGVCLTWLHMLMFSIPDTRQLHVLILADSDSPTHSGNSTLATTFLIADINRHLKGYI